MANEQPLLLDVTRLIWRRWVGRLPTGIDRVCLAYLAHFGSNAQAVIQRRGVRRIISESASERLFGALLAPGRNVRRDLVHILAQEGLQTWRTLPGSGRLYLNVGHTALQDRGYLAWARAADVRPVYMVHDLIPITHPEYCRPGEAQLHARRMHNMLASAAGIIGNSQATLDRLVAFATSEGMAMPAEIAAPLGTEIRRIIASSVEMPERPTFIVLGTIEARKNHLMLLQIWQRFVRAYGADAPRLLVIGQRGWECGDAFDLLDRNELLPEAVVEIGRCGDAELTGHLRTARALLFPSLVEGYGLPLVEALGAGTPVIASDLTVFREIGQDIPDFIDPLDEAQWEKMILSYAGDGSARRLAQLARLDGYRPPTWNDHFARVKAWLATL